MVYQRTWVHGRAGPRHHQSLLRRGAWALFRNGPEIARAAVGPIAAIGASAGKSLYDRFFDNRIGGGTKRSREDMAPRGRVSKFRRTVVSRAPARFRKATGRYTTSKRRPVRSAKRVYKKKMKKASKAATAGSYYKKGLVRKVETSATSTNADVCYVGHAFAPNQVFYTVVENLVRVVFKRLGHAVVSMNDIISGSAAPGSFLYTYRSDSGSTEATISIPVVINATYEDVAGLLNTSIISSMTGIPDFLLLNVAFQVTNNVTPDNLKNVIIDCTRMSVEFMCDSTFKLQNRTLAVSATAADNELYSDIASNPINGKVYTGYGNGPVVREQTLTAPAGGWTLANAKGTIIADPYTTLPAKLATDFRRPPHKSAFMRATGQRNVVINPGTIIRSSINWHKKQLLNGFMNDVQGYLVATGGTVPTVNFGKFELFGLERLCNATAASVAVGFELNATYRVQFQQKMATTNAVVAVI